VFDSRVDEREIEKRHWVRPLPCGDLELGGHGQTAAISVAIPMAAIHCRISFS
jgi:hypothetical protein